MFLFLSLSSANVSACECDPPKPQKLFRDAKAVFVGQVIDIGESTVPLDKGFPPLSYAVKFKVKEYWKGVKGSEITVYSDLGGLPCHQFAYRKGDTYLVYAFGKDLISITGCTRSGSIDADYVMEQLKLFGKGKVPKEIKAKRGSHTARRGFNFEVQHATSCQRGPYPPRRYPYPQPGEAVKAGAVAIPSSYLFLPRVALTC